MTGTGTAAAGNGTGRDIGVVVVAYDGSDVIAGCLESLMAAQQAWTAATGGRLRVVVVDNASQDDTVAAVHGWADGTRPFVAPEGGLPFPMAPRSRLPVLAEGGPERVPAPEADVTLLQSGANRGFAGGVNVGLAYFARDPEVAWFWVLNPDSMAPAAGVAALGAYLADTPQFGMAGGRVIYLDRPETVQIEGGLLNRWTGVTGNYNLSKPVTSPAPKIEELDFITGASVVASRGFYEATGPMQDDYFLYYEEVDWAMRRGDWALAYVPGFDVYHWGGTAIGSPIVGRPASPFSLYFKHRARIRFQSRYHPWALPAAWAYSLAQAVRTATVRKSPEGGWAILAASFGLPVPKSVSSRLRPDAAEHAFCARRPAPGPATSGKMPSQ